MNNNVEEESDANANPEAVNAEHRCSKCPYVSELKQNFKRHELKCKGTETVQIVAKVSPVIIIYRDIERFIKGRKQWKKKDFLAQCVTKPSNLTKTENNISLKFMKSKRLLKNTNTKSNLRVPKPILRSTTSLQ